MRKSRKLGIQYLRRRPTQLLVNGILLKGRDITIHLNGSVEIKILSAGHAEWHIDPVNNAPVIFELGKLSVVGGNAGDKYQVDMWCNRDEFFYETHFILDITVAKGQIEIQIPEDTEEYVPYLGKRDLSEEFNFAPKNVTSSEMVTVTETQKIWVPGESSSTVTLKLIKRYVAEICTITTNGLEPESNGIATSYSNYFWVEDDEKGTIITVNDINCPVSENAFVTAYKEYYPDKHRDSLDPETEPAASWTPGAINLDYREEDIPCTVGDYDHGSVFEVYQVISISSSENGGHYETVTIEKQVPKYSSATLVPNVTYIITPMKVSSFYPDYTGNEMGNARTIIENGKVYLEGLNPGPIKLTVKAEYDSDDYAPIIKTITVWVGPEYLDLMPEEEFDYDGQSHTPTWWAKNYYKAYYTDSGFTHKDDCLLSSKAFYANAFTTDNGNLVSANYDEYKYSEIHVTAAYGWRYKWLKVINSPNLVYAATPFEIAAAWRIKRAILNNITLDSKQITESSCLFDDLFTTVPVIPYRNLRIARWEISNNFINVTNGESLDTAVFDFTTEDIEGQTVIGIVAANENYRGTDTNNEAKIIVNLHKILLQFNKEPDSQGRYIIRYNDESLEVMTPESGELVVESIQTTVEEGGTADQVLDIVTVLSEIDQRPLGITVKIKDAPLLTNFANTAQAFNLVLTFTNGSHYSKEIIVVPVKGIQAVAPSMAYVTDTELENGFNLASVPYNFTFTGVNRENGVLTFSTNQNLLEISENYATYSGNESEFSYIVHVAATNFYESTAAECVLKKTINTYLPYITSQTTAYHTELQGTISNIDTTYYVYKWYSNGERYFPIYDPDTGEQVSEYITISESEIGWHEEWVLASSQTNGPYDSIEVYEDDRTRNASYDRTEVVSSASGFIATDITPTWTYDTSKVTMDVNTKSAKGIGKHYTDFKLKDSSTRWEYTSIPNGWPYEFIMKKGTGDTERVLYLRAYWYIDGLRIPTISPTSFQYDGANHKPTVSNYNSNLITITNNAQRSVGSYNVIASFKTNNSAVKWEDGTTSAKSLSWKINGQITYHWNKYRQDIASSIVTQGIFTATDTIHDSHTGTSETSYNTEYFYSEEEVRNAGYDVYWAQSEEWYNPWYGPWSAHGWNSNLKWSCSMSPGATTNTYKTNTVGTFVETVSSTNRNAYSESRSSSNEYYYKYTGSTQS